MTQGNSTLKENKIVHAEYEEEEEVSVQVAMFYQ